METIFDGSITLLYIVGFIIIVSNTLPTKKKKLAIIYYYSIGVAYTGKIKTINLILLLVVSLFIYEEYLSEDAIKLKYIDKLSSKIVDFVFQYIFYYRIIFVLLAIISRSWLFMNSAIQISLGKGFSYDICIICLRIIPFAIVTIGVHRMYYEKYGLRTFSEVERKLSDYPYYKIDWVVEDRNGELYRRLRLVTEIEDKTFFDRRKGHSFLSIDFLCINARKKIQNRRIIRRNISKKKGEFSITKCTTCITQIRKDIKRLFRWIYRGRSTIEMQLIRVLFCKKMNVGRPKNPVDFVEKLRRKLFEIIYSSLFFEGLKRSLYPHNKYFKQYIVYLYVNSVQTKIYEKRYAPLTNFLECEDFSKCSIEKLFLAILGLDHSKITMKKVYRHYELLELYNISLDELESLMCSLQRAKLQI